MKLIILLLSIYSAGIISAQTIAKFDHTNSPIHDYITCLYVDSKGNIWAGANKFDGKNWTTYSTSDGLISNRITAVFEDSNGTMWFGSADGISKFDGNNWDNLSENEGIPKSTITSFSETTKGEMLIGTDGKGLIKYSKDFALNFREENGFFSNRVKSLLFDKDSTLWVGTYSGKDPCGLIEINNESWRSFSSEDGLAYEWVNDLAVDSQNNIWVGTDYGGVSKFDGKAFTNFTEMDGLTSDGVYAVSVDKEGNIWFGTHNFSGRTVCKFDGTSWTDYPIEKNVHDIVCDQEGNIWILASGILYKMDFSDTATSTASVNINNFISFLPSGNIIFDIPDFKRIKVYDTQGKLLAIQNNNVLNVKYFGQRLILVYVQDNLGNTYSHKVSI